MIAAARGIDTKERSLAVLRGQFLDNRQRFPYQENDTILAVSGGLVAELPRQAVIVAMVDYRSNLGIKVGSRRRGGRTLRRIVRTLRQDNPPAMKPTTVSLASRPVANRCATCHERNSHAKASHGTVPNSVISAGVESTDIAVNKQLRGTA
jgi:hypothetical protein